MSKTFQFGNGEWAVGKETVLAYNDENNNFKPLPFTFDRASTATVVNSDGLIETVGIDEPRIDFLNNSKGHLLLEPSRTNYALNSNDASQWTDVGGSQSITKTQNYSTAPDGSLTATRLQATATGSNYSLISISTTSFTGDYAGSVYLKSNTGSTENVIVYGRNTSVTSYPIGNEWQRIEIQGSGTSGQNLYLFLGSFPNNGSDESVDILVWGGQLEAGSYATSYIPTSGSAVTRSAETCNNAGNSTVFNDSEGVLYVEIAALADDGTSRRISLSDASTSDTVEIILQNTGRVDYQVKSGNSFQGGGFFNLTQTEYNKIAVKYKSNDLALWVNGSERSTDNSANTPIGLSELAFDNGGGGSDFCGKVKDIKVYNTALTDAELIALTS